MKIAFVIILLFVIIYTIILSRIDAVDKIHNQTIKLSNSLIFFSGNNLFIRSGSNSSSIKLNLQGSVSSAARWLGYSKHYNGILFIDDISDRLGVLHINAKKHKAQVSKDIYPRDFKGEWGLHKDMLYSVKVSSGALFLESHMLENNIKTNNTQSIRIPLPISINNDLGRISKPSICGNLLAFSIASNIYLIDINKNKANLIGNGVDPAFLNKDIVVYGKELQDPNHISLDLFFCKTKKYRRCDVWEARGLARLPILIPMVPHQRPDDINRIEPMNEKNLLLVEVTRHNYGNSYLFMVDTSKDKSVCLPYSPDRSRWSFYASEQ